MKELSIGEVTITSIIERDGPWRTPEEMFPAYDPIIDKHHLAELDPAVFDPASGKMVITYQTYIVRTSRHTTHRYMHRRGQRLSAADGLSETALARWFCGGGFAFRRY
jgi:hypothetical protein